MVREIDGEVRIFFLNNKNSCSFLAIFNHFKWPQKLKKLIKLYQKSNILHQNPSLKYKLHVIDNKN